MGEELIDSAFLDRRAARACFLVCRTYIISSTQARQHSQHTKTRIYLGPLSLCLSLHGPGLAGLGWSWLELAGPPQREVRRAHGPDGETSSPSVVAAGRKGWPSYLAIQW